MLSGTKRRMRVLETCAWPGAPNTLRLNKAGIVLDAIATAGSRATLRVDNDIQEEAQSCSAAKRRNGNDQFDHQACGNCAGR
jgi:hypothetical protein